MEQRAIVDVVCRAGVENLAGEIGALLGQDLTCSDIQLELQTKNALFSDPGRPKSALGRMTVSGDREGESYLLTPLRTAVTLGGTLIMLPQDMIEENAKAEQLDGELNDAFGEVANIIAGVFTQAFVDKYPQSLRFIKSSIEELVPSKIDVDSETPFAPGSYYIASGHLHAGETDLGRLEFVVPAAIFELDEAPAEHAEEQPEASTEQTQQPVAAAAATPASQTAAASAESPEPPQQPPRKPFAESKKLVDVVFNATIDQTGEEIGALLGQTLKCDDVQLVLTDKSKFFGQHCLEKSVLTHLKVTGDKETLGFLVVQVPDAVILGGTLIMLPEDQIEEQSKAGEFDGEVADSFGEIANILAGSLTQVFLDRYPEQLRFIKTDSEIVIPTKIDPAADIPFPDDAYYLASFAIHLEGHELHRMQLLFPASTFNLDSEVTVDEASGTSRDNASGSAAPTAATGQRPAPGEWGGPPAVHDTPAAASSAAPSEGAALGSAPDPDERPPLVLLLSDQSEDAAAFEEILTSAGYSCRILGFQEDIKSLFRQHRILGIFLIMAQVGEKGFATAIKLQSSGGPMPPLIFAGPEWTRSAVLRAVKYGARDILVMPASGEEIQEKVELHLLKAS